jgi:hypothetical protein
VVEVVVVEVVVVVVVAVVMVVLMVEVLWQKGCVSNVGVWVCCGSALVEMVVVRQVVMVGWWVRREGRCVSWVCLVVVVVVALVVVVVVGVVFARVGWCAGFLFVLGVSV